MAQGSSVTVAQHPPRLAHGDDLGVGRGVMVGDVAVPALAQHLSVGTDQDGAYRDLIEFALGPVRQREGVAHPLLVVQTGHHSHSIVAGGLPEMS